MTVDYDLIILGGSWAARTIAQTAAQYKARVALVEPESGVAPWEIYCQAWGELGRVSQQLLQAESFQLQSPASPNLEEWQLDGQQAKLWTEAIVAGQEALRSPVTLAACGVDVVQGTSYFESRPHLSLVVNNRRLRARAYLLAPAYQPLIPDIPGLVDCPYLTSATIWQHPLPKSVFVLGGDPSGLALAQALTRLGTQVTLAIQGSHLLPREDAEIAQLLQAQLEAEGVRILTESPVTQVRFMDGQPWVQTGNQAIAADAIVLATGLLPLLDGYNLEAVKVQRQRQGIAVNAKLQTTNPRIYACQGMQFGYPLDFLARYEAQIAVKNALFFPWNRVNNAVVPWIVGTDPELARVGLSETQALEQYGKSVFIVRHAFQPLLKAQLWGQTTGMCKLIVHRNGRLLGAHLLGPAASEVINLLTLAIQQRIRISTLASLPCLTPSWTEVLQQAAVNWQLQVRSPQHDWLETFFRWRRS